MRPRSARPTIGLALVAVIVLAGCSAAPTPTSPTPNKPVESTTAADDVLAAFYEQPLDWRECGGAECTKVQVPLDYDDPTGARIELSLTKVPATGESIGALLVNPGGPGGSAFDYAKAADYIVSPSIRESFDIVGVDPRGVAGSEPVKCLSDEQIDRIFAADGTPDDPQEVRDLLADSASIARACQDEADEIWRFMDTATTARDMDIVREVLAQPVLNYLGKSYGTAIGATYAELFPDRVGRMVLDGALPVGMSHEDVTYGQAVAFEKAAAHFADYCAESGDCPFAGNSGDVVTQIRSFLTRLDSSPLPTRDGRQLTESLGSYAVLSHLYFPGSDYPRLKRALAEAVDGDGTALITLMDERVNRGQDGRYLDNSTDAFYAVTCSDMPFEGAPEDAAALARGWSIDAPTFGPALAWGMLVCADWPVRAKDPVTGVSANGSAPILVVSTVGDTATPHEWGIDLAASLFDGHLVTWDAFNHTAYGEGSACIDRAVDAYLLAGELPPSDLVCS
ncbi:MAG: alpha/beta hydrolase [Candidatus Nanopelagicales bacterium]